MSACTFSSPAVRGTARRSPKSNVKRGKQSPQRTCINREDQEPWLLFCFSLGYFHRSKCFLFSFLFPGTGSRGDLEALLSVAMLTSAGWEGTKEMCGANKDCNAACLDRACSAGQPSPSKHLSQEGQSQAWRGGHWSWGSKMHLRFFLQKTLAKRWTSKLPKEY